MERPFDVLSGLRIAVEMEKRGEVFYRRAATVSVAADARGLLEGMARDESRHMHEFLSLLNELNDREPVRTAFGVEASAYLSAIAAEIVFPGGLMSVGGGRFDSRAAILDSAMAAEKDSILFYMELADQAGDPQTRDVFQEIARQEKAHLSQLIAMR